MSYYVERAYDAVRAMPASGWDDVGQLDQLIQVLEGRWLGG